MKYAFYVVICKTPSCSAVIPLRYLGEFEEVVPVRTIPADLPESVDLECKHCGKAHRYILAANLKARFLEAPPAAEFRGL